MGWWLWAPLWPLWFRKGSEKWLFFPVKTIKTFLLSDPVVGSPFYLPLTTAPPAGALTLPGAFAAGHGGFAGLTATVWFPLATTSGFETQFRHFQV